MVWGEVSLSSVLGSWSVGTIDGGGRGPRKKREKKKKKKKEIILKLVLSLIKNHLLLFLSLSLVLWFYGKESREGG